MKTLEKEEMLERNKVMRVLTEEQILQAVDHPFLASLAGTIETPTHLHFLMEFCEGGELYAILTSRPMKRMKESHMRFYCAEVRSDSKRQSRSGAPWAARVCIGEALALSFSLRQVLHAIWQSKQFLVQYS